MKPHQATLHRRAHGTVVLGRVVAQLLVFLLQILILHMKSTIFAFQLTDQVSLVFQLFFQSALLFHSLSTAVLRIAPVLECSSFLLHSNNVILGKAVQSFVQLAHGQLYE